MLLKLSRSHEVGATVGPGLPEWENNSCVWTLCPFKSPSQTPAVAMLLWELGWVTFWKMQDKNVE